jgi:two-component system response regulator HydG
MLDRFFKDPRFMIDVFETMRDGLLVVDTEGHILFMNRAAEEITGYRKEEVLGKSCTLLDGDTCVVSTESGKEKSCDLFRTGSLHNKQCRIRSGQGKSVYLLKNAAVLKDGNSEIIGAVESITDITSLYMKEMELEELKEELRQEYWFMGILGRSAPMQRLFEQIQNAAISEAPVLISGESGVGKGLVADAIHKLSRRKDGPFIKMNCGSLNDYLLESELFGHVKGSFTGAIGNRVGRFEAANTGSIFLDEIGDMPLLMQVKLLRVLEEKVVERVGDNLPIQVDVRLISATNRDLPYLVAAGNFREDLLYRVNSISIKVPPLRERVEDIPIIALHFLKKISRVNKKEIRRVTSQAMEIIENYRWPGNVRQLINALEHSVITCKDDTIEITDLPDYIFREHKDTGKGMPSSESRIDREKIRLTLSLYKGNKTLAARHLGISRVTLWKKLKELGLNPYKEESGPINLPPQ